MGTLLLVYGVPLPFSAIFQGGVECTWYCAGEQSCCGEFSRRCGSVEILSLLVPTHSCCMYQMSPRLLGLQSDEDLSMRVTATLLGS